MLVSVIIPYFRDEKNISNSINSVLKQSYDKIEIIIIDDENSKNLIKYYQILKIRKLGFFKQRKIWA